MDETKEKKPAEPKVKKAKKAQKPKKQKGVPNYNQMSLSTRRILFGSFLLLFLIGVYSSLFFVPKFPGFLWLRLLLALVFAALMGTGIFLIIKKRLTAKDLQYIEDEENIARAIRALKLAKFYTKKFPGFPHGIRKEIFPATIASFVIFLFLCLVSPCRPPEAELPNLSKLAAQEFYYPFLFAASDSQAILAPPMLSLETEEWADKIPPKYIDMTMYAELFHNRFEAAYAIGNLYEPKTSGILTAMAQASMLEGEYARAVSEYEGAMEKNQSPEIVFQYGIALAYAGRLKEAAEVLDSLDVKVVKQALNDEFALPHWKLVIKILQGDLSQETLDGYKKFEELAKRAAKTASTQPKAETGEKTESPQKGSKKSEAAALKAQTEALAAQRLQERRAMCTGNNAAILQLFAGKYTNAIPTANSVLLLARGKARRSAKLIQMTAMNTKGYAVGNLRSSAEDQVKELAADSVFDSQAGYFAKTRTLYEEALALELDEGQTVKPDVQKDPFFLLPWVAELNFTLSDQFTSKEFPDAKSMQEKYADLLALCESLHKRWVPADVNRVPAFAVAIENLLMRTTLILDGQDRDENVELALKVCSAKLQKENALPLLATRTLRTELNLLGRFGADEVLAIKMYEKLNAEQKKTQKASRELLPETHPLLARQELAAMRLTLIQQDLDAKDFKAVNTAMASAAAILESLKLPAENWVMCDFTEAQRLVSALKKKEASEIQTIFAPEIKAREGNLFRQSWVYRDLAFALQHRDFMADADSANRSARAIFNQDIYRNNTQHFLILQVDKMLKH